MLPELHSEIDFTAKAVLVEEEEEEEVEEPEEPSETKMLTVLEEQELEAECQDEQKPPAESEELQPHVDQSGPELPTTVIPTLVELSEENEVDLPESRGDGTTET